VLSVLLPGHFIKNGVEITKDPIIKNCFFEVPGGNFSEGCPPSRTTRKMATSHREFLRDDGASNMYFQGVTSHDVFPTLKIWRSFFLFFCESSSSTERFGRAVKNAPNSRHGCPKNGVSLSSQQVGELDPTYVGGRGV